MRSSEQWKQGNTRSRSLESPPLAGFLVSKAFAPAVAQLQGAWEARVANAEVSFLLPLRQGLVCSGSQPKNWLTGLDG